MKKILWILFAIIVVLSLTSAFKNFKDNNLTSQEGENKLKVENIEIKTQNEVDIDVNEGDEKNNIELDKNDKNMNESRLNETLSDEGVQELSKTVFDISEYNNIDNCRVVFQNKVFDITKWLNKHPGTAGQILPYCGSEEFEKAFLKRHGQKAEQFFSNAMAKGYIVEIKE